MIEISSFNWIPNFPAELNESLPLLGSDVHLGRQSRPQDPILLFKIRVLTTEVLAGHRCQQGQQGMQNPAHVLWSGTRLV